MSNQSRQPKGLPTGGQFAASQQAEAEGVALNDAPDTYTAESLDECVASGAHLTSVDEDGYCNHCGDDTPLDTGLDHAIAKILDEDDRAACTEYTSRYAPAPGLLDYEAGWTSLSQKSKSARDLAVGDRLESGRIITSLDTRTPGVVYVRTDGHTSREPADHVYSHGDPVTVHEDRVDLSDPDWFEVEAARVATQRTVDEQIATGTMSDERRAEITTEVRRALTRAVQPTNISPLFHDGPGADPRIAHGRAKVGDSVTYSQPMYGDSSYEVLGKQAQRVILGHDGTSVQWGENGDVEYVLRDIVTGHQTTSNLRGPGWKRIPAPGDHGPGAQAQRLDR